MVDDDVDNSHEPVIQTSRRSFDDSAFSPFANDLTSAGATRTGIQEVYDMEGDEQDAEPFVLPPLYETPVRRADPVMRDPFDAMPAFEITMPEPVLTDRSVTVMPSSDAQPALIVARSREFTPFATVQIGAGTLDTFTRKLGASHSVDNAIFPWCRQGSWAFSNDGLDARPRHKFTRHYPLDRILVDVFAHDSARVRHEVEEKMAAIEAEAAREGLPIGYLAVVRGCVLPEDVFARVKAGEVLPLHLEVSQIYSEPSPVLTFL